MIRWTILTTMVAGARLAGSSPGPLPAHGDPSRSDVPRLHPPVRAGAATASRRPQGGALTAGVAILSVIALTTSGCGNDPDDTPGATHNPVSAAYAQVASYDLAADRPQRFIVGLTMSDGGLLVGGSVDLRFEYVSPPTGADTPDEPVIPPDPVTATFLPIAGTPDHHRPRRNQVGGGGVYEVEGLTFDAAGFWEVTVQGTVDSTSISTTAAFEVLPAHQIPTSGTPAPPTVNHLAGDPEIPARAIDSRAADDGTVPDPELHRITVADALSAETPTVVVVSTPVFCVSRFCGPITDSVQSLASRYAGQASFVHLEVWLDFENRVVNPAAAEWIYPDPSVDAYEPWVFLVDANGTIARRWDNVTNEAQIEDALLPLLETGDGQ